MKLIFHRSTMKSFENFLQKSHIPVTYIPATKELADIRILVAQLKKQGYSMISMYDPCDEWLEKRVRRSCREWGITLVWVENPMFINSRADLSNYQDRRKNYFLTDFYVHQRKSRNLLLNPDASPLNGKWSFDAENRAKYPSGKKPPALSGQDATPYHQEAVQYIETHFASNPGEIDPRYFYPVNQEQAAASLRDFFRSRFADFGQFEDAIVHEEVHLHHSVLSPLLNSGLLLPMEVIDQAIDYASGHAIPYNSLEGFVRQILGWREFIRMVYIREGNRQRTRNFWKFHRKIPPSFYSGKTGIEPVDAIINKLRKTAYNHHIERLMILSNFMLLCEFDPDEVYRWFMEMYIDAYDWVMVPNLYGMGQFADGGLMSTKPYISGSNYILKMSNFKKGEPWAELWDALFWRFMHKHRSFFLKNPRMGMLIKTFDKWNPVKQQGILQKAEAFLRQLDTQA